MPWSWRTTGTRAARDTGTAGRGLRGYEYDLRITYIPVDWINILNFFALGGTTYVLFYVVVDIVLVFVIIIGWGCFRLAVRSANPPAPFSIA